MILVAVAILGLSFSPLTTGHSNSPNNPLVCIIQSSHYNTSPDGSAYAKAVAAFCSPGYSGLAYYEVYVGNSVNPWLGPQWTICGQRQLMTPVRGNAVLNLYVSQYFYGSNTNCQWDSSGFSVQGMYMQPNTLYSTGYPRVNSGVNLTAWTWSDACSGGALPPPPAYPSSSQGAQCTAVTIAHYP